MAPSTAVTYNGGTNIAMKVPPHLWDATVSFYRDVLGLEELEPFTGTPPSVGFVFGPNRLWIDRVVGMSQAELWLEIVADDPTAAADDLATAAGVARCDEIEPLPAGGSSFWIQQPSVRRPPRRTATVVEQDARWCDVFGVETSRSVVASQFRVDAERIVRIARHDELAEALIAAGLDTGDEVTGRR